MSRYVDGFVLPIPKKNLQKYKKMASEAGKLWIKHGALGYFECVGDDLTPNTQGMKVRTFPQIAKTKPDETVIFAFIIYKSRTHRDRVNAKVMKDASMKDMDCDPKAMPFDTRKMAFGGFSSLVHYEQK